MFTRKPGQNGKLTMNIIKMKDFPTYLAATYWPGMHTDALSSHLATNALNGAHHTKLNKS